MFKTKQTTYTIIDHITPGLMRITLTNINFAVAGGKLKHFPIRINIELQQLVN